MQRNFKGSQKKKKKRNDMNGLDDEVGLGQMGLRE